MIETADEDSGIKTILVEESTYDQPCNIKENEVPAITEGMLKSLTADDLETEYLEWVGKQYGVPLSKQPDQATFCGICDKGLKLENSPLVVNEDNTVGVKWKNVDKSKKEIICNLLGYFGWKFAHGDSGLFPYLKRESPKEADALRDELALEKILEGIGDDLFVGSRKIFQLHVKNTGSYDTILGLEIKSITEENLFNRFFNEIVGKSMDEVNNEIVYGRLMNLPEQERCREFMKFLLYQNS